MTTTPYLITSAQIDLIMTALEPLEQYDRSGPDFTRARRYTFIGTNTSKVDVLISDPVGAERFPVLRLTQKAGRYDGAVRDRLVIRWYTAQALTTFPYQPADIEVYVCPDFPDRLQLVINSETVRSWRYTRPMVRGGVDELAPIILWHWERYYRMLPEDDVRALAASLVDGWASGQAPPTLAQCNRLASRALYRLARDLGWRKLTERERHRLALESMWVREEVYAEAQELRRGMAATGAGEFSEYESAGRLEVRAVARMTLEEMGVEEVET